MKFIITVASISLLLFGCKSVDRVRYDINIDETLAAQAFQFEIVKADTLLAEAQLNISAGDYKITNMDQSWQQTETMVAFDISLFINWLDRRNYTSRQSLKFELHSEAGHHWKARCERRTAGKESDIHLNTASILNTTEQLNSAYQCGFIAEDGQRWDLKLLDSFGAPLQANFTSATGELLDIQSFSDNKQHVLQNTYQGRLGFYLQNNKVKVAAVSTLPLGQVWLKQNLSEVQQDNVALAAIGLWLFHNAFY